MSTSINYVGLCHGDVRLTRARRTPPPEVGADRDLTVERNVQVTDVAKPRCLRDRRLGHGGEVTEAAVVRGGEAEIDRGVDVEAVDLVGPRRRRVAHGDSGSIGVKLRGIEVGPTCIEPTGDAEPAARVFVVCALEPGERALEIRRRRRGRRQRRVRAGNKRKSGECTTKGQELISRTAGTSLQERTPPS
jgi:hypothetical protein